MATFAPPGVCLFESNRHSNYPGPVKTLPPTLSPDGLRTALRAFCERHPIRRLDVFGSAARGQASPRSDVDLLVTLDGRTKPLEDPDFILAPLLLGLGSWTWLRSMYGFRTMGQEPAELWQPRAWHTARGR